MTNHETQSVPANALRCVAGALELGDNGESAKTAPFRMVARTGDAIDHWYWGKVVHDLAGMRLHKERLPIDYVHDESEVIGYANHFDASSGDLSVTGALVPFKESDRATEIIHKSRHGIPYEASINFGGDGIRIQRYEEGELVEVNGRAFTGPLTVIREWPLRGIAVCPYGADANTSTLFSQTEVEVEIMERTELTEAVEAQAVDTATENDTPVEAAAAAVETDLEPAAAAAELKKTGPEYLAAFGEKGGVWYAEGKSWEESQSLFQRSLIERIADLEKKLAASSPHGERDPVSFSTQEGNTKRGLAGKIRFAGQS